MYRSSGTSRVNYPKKEVWFSAKWTRIKKITALINHFLDAPPILLPLDLEGAI